MRIAAHNLVLALWFAWAPSAAAPPAQEHVLHHSRYSALVAGSADLLDLNADFTVEAWIWLEEASGGTRLLGQAHASEGSPAQALTLLVGGGEPNSIALLASNASEQRYIASVDPAPLHRWVHVAVRRDDSGLHLLVDGVAVGSQPPIVLPSEGLLPWTFGGMPRDVELRGFGGFPGHLRRIRLWQRALNVTELEIAATTEPAPDAPGLVASWPLDEGTGRVALNRIAAAPPLQFGGDFSDPPCAASPGMAGSTCVADPAWRRTGIVDGGPYFVSATPVRLLPPESSFAASYAALIDLGQDGYPDVYLVTSRFPEWPKAPHVVARNDAGILRDATAEVLGATDAWTRAPRDLVVEDFNGDGREDLIVAEQGYDNGASPGGQNRLLLQNADGSLSDVTDSHLPILSQFAHSACSGDLDGDGDRDVVVGSIGGSPLGFPGPWSGTRPMLNDGTGHFTHARLFPWQLQPPDLRRDQQGWGCEILDADADNDMDMLITAGAGIGGLDVLLRNAGANGFTEIELPPRRRGPGTRSDMAQGDLNGDGLVDVVGWEPGTPDLPSDGLFFWISRGDGTFVDATGLLPDTQRSSLSIIADVDGDGLKDIVNAHSGFDAAAAIMLNLGDCRFVDASEFLPAANWLVAAGDVDQDGDLDLVNLMDDGPFPGAARGIQVLHQIKPIDVDLLEDLPPPRSGCEPLPDTIFVDGFEQLSSPP